MGADSFDTFAASGSRPRLGAKALGGAGEGEGPDGDRDEGLSQ